MKTTLSASSVEKAGDQLRPVFSDLAAHYPAGSPGRQPVHTVYGGAHLFKAETAAKLGTLAVRSFSTFASDAESFAKIFDISPEFALPVFERVNDKLKTEAVEDLRVDFEDGYGIRSNEEEDSHAEIAAAETAKGMRENTLPPFFGIRVKSFDDETIVRAIRTLDIYLTALCSETRGKLPENFVVTLPKVVSPLQISALVDLLDEIEPVLGIEPGTFKIEFMVETLQSIISPDGRVALPEFAKAGRGRCVAAHFGAYDYTAECGITAPFQDLRHPACEGDQLRSDDWDGGYRTYRTIERRFTIGVIREDRRRNAVNGVSCAKNIGEYFLG